MDRKNNLYTEAQLDNRRRSKKMSNWALELQQFNIVRVWTRGEANILADAPSRAPWVAPLARNLPIPDQPLRQMIAQMYVSPEAWEKMCLERAEHLNLDTWNAIEEELHPPAQGRDLLEVDRAPAQTAPHRTSKPGAAGEGRGDHLSLIHI